MTTKAAAVEPTTELPGVPNGSAMASFLGAGIGAFAVGMFVLLNEAGVFAPPALHAGAGGVSGRTTFAAVVWLVAWGVLHARWRDRTITPRPVYLVTLLLTGIGIAATFPPIWALL